MNDIQEHLNILKQAQTSEISFEEAERKLIKMYWKSNKATKENIINIFSCVKPRKEAFELINYLKAKGYGIFFISGAIDIYVEKLSKDLGADGYYANSKLEFDSKGILKKIHYRQEQSKIKLKQLKELSQKEKIGIKSIVFIGDSENDIDVFKATNNGIAVLPADGNLIKKAWKTVKNLSEIKEIL